MEAGTEEGLRSMSPLRVAQAIDARGGGLSGTGAVDNAILRADGTGGETLQSSDLSIEDAATATQANVALTNQHAGQTNSALVLTPKGTGALILGPKPDGTATGGNARGDNAADLQTARSAATQVASGAGALAAGRNNTVSGACAVAAGEYHTASGAAATALGYSCSATGNRSLACGSHCTASQEAAAAIGASASASGVYSLALGAGANLAIRAWLALGGASDTAIGVSQQMMGQLFASSASTDAVTLATHGTRPTIPAGKTWLVEVWVVGAQADGSSGWGMYRACLKRVGTTTALVGSAVEVVAFSGDAGLGSPTITVSADDTNEALSVAVTPANATATKWSAAVWALQVNH